MFKHLLSLLSVLFAGPQPPAYPPPYPPPMPPYYMPPPKKDNTLKIVVIIVIILVIVPIIVTIILAGMLYFWVSSFMGEGFTPSATLSTPAETKIDSTYYYNTTTTDIDFPLYPGNVNFTITGHGTIPLKKFYPYYTVIEEYQNISSGVALLWVDNDDDKRVSETDMFSIKTDNIDLSGETIMLIYTPTQKTIASIAIS